MHICTHVCTYVLYIDTHKHITRMSMHVVGFKNTVSTPRDFDLKASLKKKLPYKPYTGEYRVVWM